MTQNNQDQEPQPTSPTSPTHPHYSKEDKLRIIVGYLANGNSFWDLVEMVYHDVEETYEDLFDSQPQSVEDLEHYKQVGKGFEDQKDRTLA